MNSKEKERVAVARAISHFMSCGWVVCLPICDTERYDFVIVKDGKFKTVQCKYTGQCRRPGVYQVLLGVCGGNKSRNTKLLYKQGDFDIFFVVDGDGNAYEIPMKDLGGLSCIHVGIKTISRWVDYLVP